MRIDWKKWIVGGAGSAFTDSAEKFAQSFIGGLPGGLFGINTAQLLVGILAAYAVDNHKVKGLGADFVAGIAITEFGNIIAPFISSFTGGFGLAARAPAARAPAAQAPRQSSVMTSGPSGYARMLAVR